MRVGFIGLGTMGSRMAANVLTAGHQLVVHDLDPATGQALLDAGAVWAVSPASLAGQVDVVFTSLPGPTEVEAVALNPNGIINGALPGLAWFDLSTNSPTVMRRIYAELTPRGVHVLDAPVSGGPDGAASGRLAIWVGGDPEVFAAHVPLLRSFSDAPHLVGPIGAGSVAKLVHNASGYIIQTALAETFTLGVKAGVDPDALWEAVRTGALGRRRTFDSLSRNFLPGRFDPPDFSLQLARKDVSLACELGRELDVPLRLANLTLMELTEAINRGWAGRDSRSAMLLQEERSGVEVRVAPERIAEILADPPPQAAPAGGEPRRSWFDRTLGRVRGRNRAESPPDATAPHGPARGAAPAPRPTVIPPSAAVAPAPPATPTVAVKPPSVLDEPHPHHPVTTGPSPSDPPASATTATAAAAAGSARPPSILDPTGLPDPARPVDPTAADPADVPSGGVTELPDPARPIDPTAAEPGGTPLADTTGGPAAPDQDDDEAPSVRSPLFPTPLDDEPSLLDRVFPEADPLLEAPTVPVAPRLGAVAPANDVNAASDVVSLATNTLPLVSRSQPPATPGTNGSHPPDTGSAATITLDIEPAEIEAAGRPAASSEPDGPPPTGPAGDGTHPDDSGAADDSGDPRPKGWHYGWTVVSAVFVILMVTSGLGFYNAAVILRAAIKELDAPVGAVSVGTALFFGISGITGFLLARIMDRVDIRWFYAAGGLLGAGALYSLRWVESVAQLYLFFAVFGIGFALAGLVPGTTLVTRWFSARRSIAISIASTGLSLGGIALTPISSNLIEGRGLAGAGPVLSIVWLLGVIPIGLLLIRSRPAERGMGPDGIPLSVVPAGQPAAPVALPGATFAAARRSRFFRLMCVAYALIFFSQVGGLAHLFNLASERVDTTTAELALSLLALTSVAGRLLGGVVVLKVPTKVLSLSLMVFQAVALTAIAFSFTRLSILASAVFLGVSVGNLLMLQPLLLAEAFGVAQYSRIYSFNQLFSTIGVAGGPVILGLVHDISSYEVSFVLAGAGSLLGFLAFLAAGSIERPLALWERPPEPASTTAPVAAQAATPA